MCACFGRGGLLPHLTCPVSPSLFGWPLSVPKRSFAALVQEIAEFTQRSLRCALYTITTSSSNRSKRLEDIKDNPFLAAYEEVWLPLVQRGTFGPEHPLLSQRGRARAGAMPHLDRTPERLLLDEFAAGFPSLIKNHISYNFAKR